MFAPRREPFGPKREPFGPKREPFGPKRDWHLDKNSHMITEDGRLVHVGEDAVMRVYNQLFSSN
jgi:hypothetical protein